MWFQLIFTRSLFLLLLTAGPVTPQSNRVELSIELSNKQIFIEGESVYLIVSLKNKGSNVVRYDGFYLESSKLTLNVTRHDGQKVNYAGPTFTIISPISHSLLPSEKVSVGLMVDGYFPTFTDAHHVYRKLTPGTYTVEAQYAMNTSVVNSNRSTFQVQRPAGRLKEALDKLEEIYVPENYFSDDTSKIIPICVDYLRSYGNSPYAPLVSNEIAWTYRRTKDRAKAVEAYKTVVRSYPNHGYALNIIQENYLRPREKAVLLDEIISKHPSSYFAKYARHLQGVKSSLEQIE